MNRTNMIENTSKERIEEKKVISEKIPTETQESELAKKNDLDVKDKVSDLADRGVAVARDVFERVKHFTSDATELTRLKVEILKLKSNRNKLFKEMGQKLWDLKKTNKFRGIQVVFTPYFKKLEELEKKISEKESEAKNIHISI